MIGVEAKEVAVGDGDDKASVGEFLHDGYNGALSGSSEAVEVLPVRDGIMGDVE